MQDSKQVFEAYNQALHYGPQSASSGATWLDVAIAVSVGLMLAIGALAYFDVLVK